MPLLTASRAEVLACAAPKASLDPTTLKRAGNGGADQAPSPAALTEEPDNPRTATASPYEGSASKVTDCAERPEPAGPARSLRLAQSALAHDHPPVGEVSGA